MGLANVFLIGYGVVAGFNVGDEKPPHCYYRKLHEREVCAHNCLKAQLESVLQN
jgi:hypothetical protein